MDPKYIQLEEAGDGVLVARLAGPGKVTTLSRAMVGALDALVAEVRRRPTARALVLAGTHPSGLMVGADLKEMLAGWESGDPTAVRQGMEEAVGHCQRVFDGLEGLGIPTVAALHGAVLGGGFELTLACQGRIAADDPTTSIGLPEVSLGLVPGAGGCQRLTRLVGMAAALELILGSKKLAARAALKKGLVHRLAPLPALVPEAVKMARELAEGRAKPGKGARRPLTLRILEAVGWGRDKIEERALSDVKKKTKGHYPAPVEAARLIAFAAEGGALSEGLRLEREALGRLASGPVARQLVRIFFLTEKAKGLKVEGGEPRKLERLGVVGAGFMGSGVAQLAASKGLGVFLKDRDEASLAKGMKTCAGLFDKLAELGKLGPGGTRVAMAGIRPVVTDRELRTADLVVEAVFEDLDLKKRVLAAVEAELRPGAVLATNTSGIPLGLLAPALKRPEDLVGMHFFSPVHKMPLLELVRGAASSPAAVATAVKLGQRLGKTVVVVRDGPGFFTTRVLGLYLAEAFRQLMAGGELETIDRGLEEFGWPVGPFKLLDEVGIEVGAKVSKNLREAFPDRVPDAAPLLQLVAKGRLGKKAKKGFYDYQDRGAGADKGVYADLGRPVPVPGAGSGAVDDVMAVLADECCRCLAEGVIAGPEDGDLALVMGLGFPPFRGGLFRWLDEGAAAACADRLEAMGRTPSERLVEAARKGRRLYP